MMVYHMDVGCDHLSFDDTMERPAFKEKHTVGAAAAMFP